jgi:putative endopeptidase
MTAAWCRWRLLNTASPKLSAAFANETFRFFSSVLSGQKVQAPRWKTCTSYTDAMLGDILGRYFVQRAFNGQSLNITQRLIKLIEVAFGDRLPEIDWMDADTRKAAQEKLSLVVDLVGYPSKWADYSSVAISGGKFYSNTYNLQQFGWANVIKVLTGPVDKTRWQMTPPTVNAYYDPSYNTINFPAGNSPPLASFLLFMAVFASVTIGIIQPTFFSALYPMAMNFGGIGMVMGV